MNIDDYEYLNDLSKSMNEEQKQLLRDNTTEEELFRLWLISFEEHTKTCDVCTLTWADDYCDEYKLLIKITETS